MDIGCWECCGGWEGSRSVETELRGCMVHAAPRLQAPPLRLGMGWRWRWDVGNGLVKGEGRWGVGTGGWGTRSQDRPDLLRTTVQSMNRRSLPQMRALPAILRASKNISSCVKLAGPANGYYYYDSAVN